MAATLAFVAALVATIATAVGGVLAVLNIREKLWPRPSAPHPLEAPLRDIAAAIREREGRS